MEPTGTESRERVAAIIRETAPFGLCPTCIASKSNIPENEVRRAMQVLVALVPHDFAVAHRLCSGCQIKTKLVVVHEQ
jgi:hypothetical protein